MASLLLFIPFLLFKSQIKFLIENISNYITSEINSNTLTLKIDKDKETIKKIIS